MAEAMTETLVFFPPKFAGISHRLRLDKSFRDAAADYLRRRYPENTAKHVERHFDPSRERARELVAGNGSLTSIEQLLKRGGFAVALPIVDGGDWTDIRPASPRTQR